MKTPFPSLQAPADDTSTAWAATASPKGVDAVTRIGPGTVLSGRLYFEGAVLLAGELRGHVRVHGRLVILPGGVASGRLRVTGDVSVLGTLGEADDVPETVLECQGHVQLDASATGHGTVLSPEFTCDPTAEWLGQHVPTHKSANLPTLKDQVAPPWAST